jgi:hypothetical protein
MRFSSYHIFIAEPITRGQVRAIAYKNTKISFPNRSEKEVDYGAKGRTIDED